MTKRQIKKKKKNSKEYLLDRPLCFLSFLAVKVCESCAWDRPLAESMASSRLSSGLPRAESTDSSVSLPESGRPETGLSSTASITGFNTTGSIWCRSCFLAPWLGRTGLSVNKGLDIEWACNAEDSSLDFEWDSIVTGKLTFGKGSCWWRAGSRWWRTDESWGSFLGVRGEPIVEPLWDAIGDVSFWASAVKVSSDNSTFSKRSDFGRSLRLEEERRRSCGVLDESDLFSSIFSSKAIVRGEYESNVREFLNFLRP